MTDATIGPWKKVGDCLYTAKMVNGSLCGSSEITEDRTCIDGKVAKCSENIIFGKVLRF